MLCCLNIRELCSDGLESWYITVRVCSTRVPCLLGINILEGDGEMQNERTVLSRTHADTIFDILEDQLSGHEFVLLVFKDESPSLGDYVSNIPPAAVVERMFNFVKGLREKIKQ